MSSQARKSSIPNIAIGIGACLAVLGIAAAVGSFGSDKVYATADLPAYVLTDLERSDVSVDLKTVEKQYSTSEGSTVWTARSHNSDQCILLTVEDPGYYTMSCAGEKDFENQGVSTGFIPANEEGGDTARLEAYLLPERVDVKSAKVSGLEAVGPHLLVGDTSGASVSTNVTFKTMESESFTFYPVGNAPMPKVE